MMEITVDQLAQLSPAMARTLIPQWLGTFVVVEPPHEQKMVCELSLIHISEPTRPY